MSVQARSEVLNVLLVCLIWERQSCLWSPHDADLKAAVHLVSAVERSGLHPQMFFSCESVSSTEALCVDCVKGRDSPGRVLLHDEEFRGI